MINIKEGLTKLIISLSAVGVLGTATHQPRYSLEDIHRTFQERGLTDFYIATDDMSYFVQVNQIEKLLWIRGRKNEGPYKDFANLPLNAPELRRRFQEGGVSDIMITSLGQVFGDDGYDYYAEIGGSAVVGEQINNQQREHLERIVQAIGNALQ